VLPSIRISPNFSTDFNAPPSTFRSELWPRPGGERDHALVPPPPGCIQQPRSLVHHGWRWLGCSRRTAQREAGGGAERVRDGRAARSGEDGLPGICWWSSHPQRGGGGPWAKRRLAVAARSPTAELVQTMESLGVVLTAYLVSTCKLMAIGELEVSRL
jgi:hypothetical protein